MKRMCLTMALWAVCLVATNRTYAGAAEFFTAHGKVTKIDKDTLVIQPASAGKRSIILKLTGTSKFTALTTRQSAGKTVFVQRDTNVRELRANQQIAVIGAASKDGTVLLSAVVQPLTK